MGVFFKGGFQSKPMKTDIIFTIIICSALAFIQTIFMMIPSNVVLTYNLVLRPLAYIVVAAIVYIYLGFDKRPVRKVYQANMLALLFIIFYALVFILISYLFGIGANAISDSPSLVLFNLWVNGSIVLFGELIRFRLIKAAGSSMRVITVFLVTIALAYGRLNDLRTVIHSEHAEVRVFIFASMFLAVTLSFVASYIAIEGSFFSTFIISFVYAVTPSAMPVLPQVEQMAWALISCFLLFISAILYHLFMNEKSQAQRMREKRLAKYRKKSPIAHVLTFACIGLIIAFFSQAFKYYPAVILTGSMTGTIDRGSIVFMEKIPQRDVFLRVGEGEIIHFYHGRMEFVHRVVGVRYNVNGEREFITQGDDNEIVDPFQVRQEDVLGIVHTFIPYVGYPYIVFHAIVSGF